MASLFSTCKKEERVFLLLLNNRLDRVLLDAIEESFLGAQGDISDLTLEEQYHLSFHVGGIVNHIRLWVDRGMQDPRNYWQAFQNQCFQRILNRYAFV